MTAVESNRAFPESTGDKDMPMRARRQQSNPDEKKTEEGEGKVNTDMCFKTAES